MKIQTSWDDGFKYDLRIAELLRKYNFPGTFYIIIDKIDNDGYLSWDDIKKLDADGFEIGSHSMTHPQDMKLLYDDQLQYEIQTSKEILESALGHNIKSFCYPRGRYDERALRLVAESGYIDARTTIVGNINPPEDELKTNTSVHAFPDRKEYKGLSWTHYGQIQFDRAKEREDSVFHLWGHSWEIEKKNQWETLENFLKYMKENS